ncbi:hypothetical protein HD597_005270 [Nonomuraea thailandensis]|uniref:Thioesterase domain-containing protein n=1 Tax=Nonomuraea thailandensis TaxID=1188745 RepID=A0A9X2GIC8_9ACTN|nr:hypothetical protein [Nonomuraea thailandensis]MCP2358250.1 hypothetical protein [Nonomuraea thailandensis]
MGTFQEAMAILRRGDVSETDLRPQWSVGGHVHGGYLLAVMSRMAGEGPIGQHPYPSSASRR